MEPLGLPDYCQVMNITERDGTVKQFVFPKALDLDRPKRPRTTFTTEQLNKLEIEFERNPYLVGTDRIALAKELGLSETQVKVWFQNRRTKNKKSPLKSSDRKNSENTKNNNLSPNSMTANSEDKTLQFSNFPFQMSKFVFPNSDQNLVGNIPLPLQSATNSFYSQLFSCS